MSTAAGTHPKKNVKRYRRVSVHRIKRGRLRIDDYVATQANLPVLVLDEVAHRSESIGSDPVGRMRESLRKKLVFVDQLQSRVPIIFLPEIHGGFQQVTVLHTIIRELTFASP